MNKKNSNNHLMWLIAMCGLLIVYYIDSMWSWSVDLAHHYALAFRISEQWVLTTSNDLTLGEMNIYPRGSHIIAAMFGVLFNSTFLGIQVTTLGSLAMLWMGILLVLNSLQIRLAVTAILSFVAIMALNAALLKLDAHGHEVVGNFFFSQLLGQSVLFIGVSTAIYLEKSKRLFSSFLFFTVLMLINAGIHLLPAIEMLGLLYGLLIVYIFTVNDSGTTLRFRLLIAFGIALSAILGIVLHPSFAAMRAISEHNGGLELNNISYPYGLFLVCLLVLAVSFKLFFLWMRDTCRDDNIAFKYLAFYGGATAALCLFQLILANFGQGSDYAVKKYSFGLITILFINLSIYCGVYISRFLDSKKPLLTTKISTLKTPILVVSLCTLFIFSVPRHKSIDVSDIVRLEQKLIVLNDTMIPVSEVGKSNVVIGLDQLPNIVNYMFSIAIMKTPRDIAIPDVWINNDLSDLSRYSYIVSTKENPIFGAIGCDSLTRTVISVVGYQCLEKRIAMANDCRSDFDFSYKGKIPIRLLEGFSVPEEHGRWTDGHLAKLSCSNYGAPIKQINMYFSPFVFGELKSQRLSVFLDNNLLGDYEIGNLRADSNPLVVIIPETIKSTRYTLIFKIPDAKSPKEVGFNEDDRKLGFYFKRIIFE